MEEKKMTDKRFTDIIQKQITQIQDTLLKKQGEYATEDRLHNFRAAANIQGCTMEEALAGMLCKHTVSIYDMVRGIGRGRGFPNEVWDEKINDHIIYLLLLKAITEDRPEIVWEED